MGNDENWGCKLFDLDGYELSKRYKYLGEGIGRKVFAIDDKYVIKIAKNGNGYYQNKGE